MPKVAKHDSKQEGEGDNGEGCRVGFPVLGNTIGIHNLLEGVGDLVGLMIRGRRLICDQRLKDCADLQSQNGTDDNSANALDILHVCPCQQSCRVVCVLSLIAMTDMTTEQQLQVVSCAPCFLSNSWTRCKRKRRKEKLTGCSRNPRDQYEGGSYND